MKPWNVTDAVLINCFIILFFGFIWKTLACKGTLILPSIRIKNKDLVKNLSNKFYCKYMTLDFFNEQTN